jgi:hypothetical protein
MVVRKTNNINIKKESKWYAFYTKSRNEKKVYQKLIEKNLECYLPIEKKLKQWNDRKVSSGNLKGLKGELVNHYNKYKVLIRIESINQNLLLQINSSNLLKLENFS